MGGGKVLANVARTTEVWQPIPPGAMLRPQKPLLDRGAGRR